MTNCQRKKPQNSKNNVQLYKKNHCNRREKDKDKRKLSAKITSEFCKQECVRLKITIRIKGLALLNKTVRIDLQSTSPCFISGYKHKLD